MRSNGEVARRRMAERTNDVGMVVCTREYQRDLLASSVV